MFSDKVAAQAFVLRATCVATVTAGIAKTNRGCNVLLYLLTDVQTIHFGFKFGKEDVVRIQLWSYCSAAAGGTNILYVW